jgi:hypothetical protein
MAVAQALWQVRSANEALATLNSEIHAHIATIVKWLVRSIGGDSPPLRSVAYPFYTFERECLSLLLLFLTKVVHVSFHRCCALSSPHMSILLKQRV